MLRSMLAIRRDPLGYLERAVARYGEVVAFPLPRTPVLLVNDPEGVRRVLQENHRGYGKATPQYTALSAVTGAGLLTADAPQWLRRRRIVQPAFHHGTLDRVAGEAVAAAVRTSADWPGRGGAGAVLDVDALAMQTTLEVVGRTLLDADLGAAGERVVAAVHDALQVVVNRVRSLPLPTSWPTAGNRRFDRAVRTLDRLCLDVVAARRARGSDGDDLLGLLLRSAGAEGGLSDREIRDELVTLVIAGHETVASSLAWTLHLLATHAGAQRELHSELDAALGGRLPVWGDLPSLAVTRSVVEESLRLYPPAWVLTRRALADDVVAGVALPAGTLVILSPWLLHRRPASWGHPTTFDPSRFAGGGVRRPEYVPFGAGPRLCIGREFALVESVLVLATWLRAHRVDPAPGPAPRVEALVTLRPVGGLPLAVSPRARFALR